jgi:hypothetical protein
MRLDKCWIVIISFVTNSAFATDGVVAQTGATAIKSSATAWVWVPADRQERFVDELRDYAENKALKFSAVKPPNPVWTTSGVTLLTPKDNRISIIMTVPGKFSAAIIVLHPEENWHAYWKEFSAYVSARHRWEDVQ